MRLVYGQYVVKLTELSYYLVVDIIVAVYRYFHCGDVRIVSFVNLKRAYVESAAREHFGDSYENAESVCHREF